MHKVAFITSWNTKRCDTRYMFPHFYDFMVKYTRDGKGKWNNIIIEKEISKADFVVILYGVRNCHLNYLDNVSPNRQIYLRREVISDSEINPDAAFIGDYKNSFHCCTWHLGLNYQDLISLKRPKKNHALSTVMTAKANTQVYFNRLKLAMRLQKADIDYTFYGKDIKPLPPDQKEEGLLDFRYSYCAENNSVRNYFTEKFIDPLLCWAKPIYWGCPNIMEYFPIASYNVVNIFNMGMVAKISRLIEEDIDYDAISEARKLILNKYNIFAVVEEIINGL